MGRVLHSNKAAPGCSFQGYLLPEVCEQKSNLREIAMNFGQKDGFEELILKRKDGAIYTISLRGLEGHQISIGREGNRTMLYIELRADMSQVRYQGTMYGKGPLQLAYENMPTEPRCEDCDAAARHAYSDATTPGFFPAKCKKHRADPLLLPASTDKT